MRCPSCEKFVSYDTEADPEEQNEPSVDGVTLSAEYRRVLPCADCGEELKESTISFDYDFSGDVDGPCKGQDEHEWEVESSEAQPTTETVTKDRHGKPIKLARYMKTLYGVELTAHLKCSRCEKEIDVSETVSEQASSFDELV